MSGPLLPPKRVRLAALWTALADKSGGFAASFHELEEQLMEIVKDQLTPEARVGAEVRTILNTGAETEPGSTVWVRA